MSIGFFYGKDPTLLEGDIDIVGLQLGKTQYINRKKVGPSVDDILYLTVFYLDPDYRKVNASFKI